VCACGASAAYDVNRKWFFWLNSIKVESNRFFFLFIRCQEKFIDSLPYKLIRILLDLPET
jgi:hypothetical protein